MPCSRGCHLGFIIFLFLLLGQKNLEVNGRKLRRDAFKELNSETADDSSNPVYYQGADGEPGVDFPTLSYIPRTHFSCAEMESGYYADTEAGCQVFHICNNGVKVSFLCPNGTIFQQSELICEWWFKVNCSTAPLLYEESAEQFQLDSIRRKESRRVTGTSRTTTSTQSQRTSFRSSTPRSTNYRTSTSKKNSPHNAKKSHTIKEDYDNYNGNQDKHHYSVSTSRSQAPSKHDQRKKLNVRPNTKKESTPEFLKVDELQEFSTPLSVSPISSIEETQVPEESSSFVKSRFNSISPSFKPSTDNPYPNHKEIYTDIQNPKLYSNSYSKLPEKSFYGTSVGPGTLSTVPVLSSDSTVTPVPTATTTQNTGAINLQENQNKTVPSTASPKEDISAFTSTTNEGTERTKLYSVPDGYTVGGVAVLTSQNNYDVTTLRPRKGESKLVFLKTTTQTPNSSPRGRKTEQVKDVSSLDFNVNSLSVITSDSDLAKSTEKNLLSTTSTPKEFKSTTILPESTSKTDGLSTLTFGTSTVIPNYSGITGIPIQNINPLAREINGVLYTTSSPRGFSLPSDISTTSRTKIVERTNFPTESTAVEESGHTFDHYTVPTPLSLYTTTDILDITDDNMKEILNSLIQVAKERLHNDNEENDFTTNRPGLIVPPSVSPNTLHSLALYFANAADINHLHPEDDYMPLNLTVSEEQAVIDMLLTQSTRVGYESLFNDHTKQPEASTTEEISSSTTTDSSDINEVDGTSEFPPQNTSVRELARLFTSALSSYLHDPEDFRKTLQGVRPTAPPIEGKRDTSSEDEEVLNFSDSDLSVKHPSKTESSTDISTENVLTSTQETTSSDINLSSTESAKESSTIISTVDVESRFGTSERPRPTLGFIIAYDTNHFSENSIDQNGENLLTADSQSSVSHKVNSLVNDGKYSSKTTETDSTITETATTSFKPRPTLNFIVALDENKSETSTESVESTRTSTNSYLGDIKSTLTWSTSDGVPDNHWTTSSDVTKLLQSALALDPLTVNHLTTSESQSTRHEIETSTKSLLASTESLLKQSTPENERFGRVLNTLMRNATNEHETVRLILKRLNLTEDEFKNRMKEIESNPLAKRLVLLLVSRCNQDKPESTVSYKEISSTTEETTVKIDKRKNSNVFQTFVDENLTDESEDTRALQLLNSLYVIASRFN